MIVDSEFSRLNTKMKKCVYCGSPNPETRDHVPSKSLFTKPYPKNLITVPCCKDCYKETTIDDEYFKTMFVLKEGKESTIEKSKLLDSIHRSFERGRGLKNEILKTAKNVEVVSEYGIYLDNSIMYDVNRDRLCSVVQRYVRGLYFYFNNDLFPLDGIITCIEVSGLKSLPPEILITLNSSYKERVLGSKTLRIQIWSGDEKYLCIWLLTFFNDVQFLAFIHPLISAKSS